MMGYYPPVQIAVQDSNNMNFIEILAIAVALAIDAFAVAMATACCMKRVHYRHWLRMSSSFGIFQTGMTLAGWLAGLSVRSLIESFDHWLAFGLLLFVAIKMIVESRKPEECNIEAKDPTRGLNLLLLSVATSIDALAVGLSLSLLNVPILVPALIIGIVAFILTFAGMQLGVRAGSRLNLGARAELAGAFVLLLIALRILHDHGVFATISV